MEEMIDPRRLARVLRHANSSPPVEAREEFYALKQAILEAYGERDGDDIQEIVKPCWGYRYATCDDDCAKCGGSGIFERKIIHLERWKLGGIIFHRPARRLLFTVWPVTIKGKIEHKRSRFAFAAWSALSMVFAPAMHLYFDQWRMDVAQLRKMEKMLSLLLGIKLDAWDVKPLQSPVLDILNKNVLKRRQDKIDRDAIPF